MKILPEQMRLYAVTDRTWLHGRKLIDVVSEAIDGGAAFVQLREKSHLEGMELSREELLAEAKKLAQLCHERGVLFVIDDDVELALEAGADGVHVGQEAQGGQLFVGVGRDGAEHRAVCRGHMYIAES